LGEFETLTLAQVFGAITVYLENQPAIDAYRICQKRRSEALRRASSPLPEGLRQRLCSWPIGNLPQAISLMLLAFAKAVNRQ
jgi:hypothetical protein